MGVTDEVSTTSHFPHCAYISTSAFPKNKPKTIPLTDNQSIHILDRVHQKKEKRERTETRIEENQEKQANNI